MGGAALTWGQVTTACRGRKFDPHTTMGASGADAVARIGVDNSSAARGFNEFVGLAKKAKERSEAALGSIGSGVQFASAFAGFGGAASVMQKSVDQLRRGFNFNAELNNAQVGIQNVLKRFDGLNNAAARRETAKALERIIELEPVTAGSLQDLTMGFMSTLAAAKGVGLQTMQNVELVAKFANAIANAGLPLDQIRQEFRSILTGTITKDSQVAKILGITNEDMSKLRGNGNAIFDFLTKKLGDFGEAGDSAQVTFSSLSSSLDKALGATTLPLFELAIKAAKDLSTQLQDQAWVEDMRAAGVDIAKTAESLLEIGRVIIAWLPSVTRLTAAFSGMAPSLVAIGAAYAGLRVKDWISDKIAFTQATREATTATKAETAAVEENSRAQAVNTARKTGRGQRTVSNASGKSLSVEDGAQFGTVLLGIPPMAGKAGTKSGMSFAQNFSEVIKGIPQSQRAQLLSSFNGVVPILMGSLATMMTDRSKGIGGRVGGTFGTAMVDGLSMMLSSLGPYGAVAGFVLQLEDFLFAKGTEIGEGMAEAVDRAMNSGKFQALERNGTAGIRDLLDKGKTGEAKTQLNNQLATAREQRSRAKGEGSKAALDNEIMTLEQMQKNWDEWVASTAIVRKQTAETAELAKAAAEAQAEKEKKLNEQRVEAWKQVSELIGAISDQKVSMLPDDQQIAALQQKLRRVFNDAGMAATVNRDVKAPDGSTMFRGRENQVGKVNSVADMEKLAALQQQQGDPIGAAKTLERLKQAQVIQQQINEAGRRVGEKQAETDKAAVEVAFKREIFSLETQINAARSAAGETDSQMVKALEDQLAVKQLAMQLQETLNYSAAEALELAKQSVTVERAAAEAKANAERQKQRGQAAGDLYAELMILRAQAEGRGQLADQMQRELDIRREAKRIAEETGMSEQRALEVAREKSRLQQLADSSRSKKDAVSASPRYNEDGTRISDGRKKIDATIDTAKTMRERDGLYTSGTTKADQARQRVEEQKAKFNEGLYSPAGRNRPDTSPMGQKAGQNAEAKGQPPDNAQVGQQVLQLMQQMLAEMK